MTLWAVVLAAGDSSRMGTPKALLDFHGRTFLETILTSMTDAGLAHRLVVLGRQAAQIKEGVNLSGTRVALNPDPSRGMLSSLQEAIKIMNGPGPHSALVALVDHPTVRSSTYRGLREAWEAAGEVGVFLSRRQGKRGHPVLLGPRALAAARHLDPTEELRMAVKAYPEDIKDVDVEDRGVNLDVDTPDDYQRLRALYVTGAP